MGKAKAKKFLKRNKLKQTNLNLIVYFTSLPIHNIVLLEKKNVQTFPYSLAFRKLNNELHIMYFAENILFLLLLGARHQHTC